jgi:hypothetical protein
MATAACAVVLAGCGGGLDGSATDAERAKVERHLRNVRDVACTHPKGVTQCEVRVRKSPVGVEQWRCEFMFQEEPGGYTGSESCWGLERGVSPANMRIGTSR